MNKSRKKYIESCEISEVREVVLGGFRQKIAIEGKRKNLPVVVCLHGGPGSPVPFSVGCRGMFPDFTDKAVMVYWDQLGCGINNFPIDDGFTIESFAGMTVDLIKELKSLFPENGLYLFGVSWGSILALKACLRVPELLSGAFVYGQFLKNNFFSGEVLAEFSDAPEKIKRQIEGIVKTGGDCEYKVLDKNLQTLYKNLRKYTNAYFNKNSEPIKIGAIVKGLLTSPDYSFKDFKAVVKNGYRGNRSLWRELINIDFTKSLDGIKIPYRIYQGDTDVVTSTKTVAETVKNSGNGNVSLKIIENSGHMPSAAGMEEVLGGIIKFIQC